MKDAIVTFLEKSHTEQEYIDFYTKLLYWHYPNPASRGLMEYASGIGFFTAPASTKYHGNYYGGLVKHSLNVLKHTLILGEALIPHWKEAEGAYKSEMVIAALFHDICKADLYAAQTCWRKNDQGKWESYDGFVIDPNVTQIGHGSESLRRIEAHYLMSCAEWVYAINYHMGKPDNWSEAQSYITAMHRYPEVLVLHTADMMSAIVEDL